MIFLNIVSVFLLVFCSSMLYLEKGVEVQTAMRSNSVMGITPLGKRNREFWNEIKEQRNIKREK